MTHTIFNDLKWIIQINHPLQIIHHKSSTINHLQSIIYNFPYLIYIELQVYNQAAMLQQVRDSEDPTQSKTIIKNCCQAIIDQVCHDYLTGSAHKFKMFNQKPATTKSDIQRVIREKKFIQFVLNKSSVYQQPPMPLKIKTKISERRQYWQEDQELREKARDFITRIKSEKRELEGKVCLLKQEEKRRQKQSLKKIQIEENIQREMARKIRKLKAQKNIKYYNQKKNKYMKDISNSLSPQKRKLSEISDEDMISRDYVKFPSPHASSLQQIMQEEMETLPLGVRQQDTQQQRYQHQQDPIGLKLHQIKVSARVKRQKNKRTKREIKKHYIISRNPTIDYSQYIQKYTNYEELERFITPKYTISERINPGNRSRTISTPVRNTRFLQKPILNSSEGQEDELQQIKRRVYSQIETEEIRTPPSYFPFLNQAKKLKKRCHTLSDAK